MPVHTRRAMQPAAVKGSDLPPGSALTWFFMPEADGTLANGGTRVEDTAARPAFGWRPEDEHFPVRTVAEALAVGKHIRENNEAFAVKACNVMAYGDVAPDP